MIVVRLALCLMLAALACSPLAAKACDIVYGDDWSFIAKAPPGWAEGCGSDALAETNLTLWPKAEKIETASALIYVTVSGKAQDTLSSFVQDEMRRFKADSPARNSMSMLGPVDVSPTRKLVHITNSTGGRDEFIEYIEGPTVFYIVVLTCESPKVTERYKAAFDAFLDSFSPASLTQSGG